MLEIHVTADTLDELKAEVAKLAVAFGVTVGAMTVEKTETGAVSGTVAGEPKRRGRKPKDAVEAAGALTEEGGESEGDAFDPFGEAEEEEPGLDLEALKKTTIARLQKLADTKAGLDTLKGLTDKYNTAGEKKFKFASLDSTIFVKIAADLDKLKVA